MTRILPVAVICALFAAAQGVYSPSDDVVTLTPSNFNREVLQSDSLWLVEFYAPWCGHCQRLTPEWKKAATALKGIVKVGAVDCDQHKALGAQFEIRGYPTIKVFGANKNRPEEYQGGRTSESIVDSALNALRALVKDRLGGRGGAGGGDSAKQAQYLQYLQRQKMMQQQQQQQQEQDTYHQHHDPEGEQERPRRKQKQQRKPSRQRGQQQGQKRQPKRQKCAHRQQEEDEE